MTTRKRTKVVSNLKRRELYRGGDWKCIRDGRGIDPLSIPSRRGNKLHYRDGRIVEMEIGDVR